MNNIIIFIIILHKCIATERSTGSVISGVR